MGSSESDALVHLVQLSLRVGDLDFLQGALLERSLGVLAANVAPSTHAPVHEVADLLQRYLIRNKC